MIAILAIAVDLDMHGLCKNLEFGINQLLQTILAPDFDWTELRLKDGISIPSEDDESKEVILAPADYPVVPEEYDNYCHPVRRGIFAAYGTSRLNFNLATMRM